MDISKFEAVLLAIFSSIGLFNTIFFIVNYFEKREEEKRKIKEILSEYEEKKKSDWRNF